MIIISTTGTLIGIVTVSEITVIRLFVKVVPAEFVKALNEISGRYADLGRAMLRSAVQAPEASVASNYLKGLAKYKDMTAFRITREFLEIPDKRMAHLDPAVCAAANEYIKEVERLKRFTGEQYEYAALLLGRSKLIVDTWEELYNAASCWKAIEDESFTRFHFKRKAKVVSYTPRVQAKLNMALVSRDASFGLLSKAYAELLGIKEEFSREGLVDESTPVEALQAVINRLNKSINARKSE